MSALRGLGPILTALRYTAGSGHAVPRAIETLAELETNDGMRRRLHAAGAQIRRGRAPGRAIADAFRGRRTSERTIGVEEAGLFALAETHGALVLACDYALAAIEDAVRTRERLLRELSYPVAVALLLAVGMGLFGTLVAPVWAPEEAPTSVHVSVHGSAPWWVRAPVLVPAVAVVAAGGGVGLWWVSLLRIHRRRFPRWGVTLRALAVALRTEVPVPHALARVAAVTEHPHNRCIAAAAAQAARGVPLREAMRQNGFPRTIWSSVESGAPFGAHVEQVAWLYRERALHRRTATLALVQPLFVAALGAVLLWFVIHTVIPTLHGSYAAVLQGIEGGAQ